MALKHTTKLRSRRVTGKNENNSSGLETMSMNQISKAMYVYTCTENSETNEERPRMSKEESNLMILVSQ